MNKYMCLTEASIGYCSSVVIQLLELFLRWFLTVLQLIQWVRLTDSWELEISVSLSSQHCGYSWAPLYPALREFHLYLNSGLTSTLLSESAPQPLPEPLRWWTELKDACWFPWVRKMDLSCAWDRQDSTACPPDRGVQGRTSDRRFCGQGWH